MQITDYPHLVLKCPWVNNSNPYWFIIRNNKNELYYRSLYDLNMVIPEIPEKHWDTTSIDIDKKRILRWESYTFALNQYIINWIERKTAPLIDEIVHDYIISRKD